MFQTKSFLSVVASMVNRARATTRRITDFGVGSAARTMMEAPAIEIDQLYQMMVAGLIEAIPVSTYNSFSFELLKAVAAGGSVTANFSSSTSAQLIAAGSTLIPTSGGSVIYTTLADVVIPAGSTTAVLVVIAGTAGSVGNLAKNSTFTLQSSLANFLNASNPVAFTNGIDIETEPQRKVRFNEYVTTLARGTVAALSYGAKKAAILDALGNITESVKLVYVDEPYLRDNTQPIGLVNVYVHNGIGSTSAALVALASSVLYGFYDQLGNPVPGYKAAGVKVVVSAATELFVNITAVLTPLTGYDKPTLIGLAIGVIAAYITSLPIGGLCVMATLYRLVMEIPGIYDFVLFPGTVDVVAGIGIKCMPYAPNIT